MAQKVEGGGGGKKRTPKVAVKKEPYAKRANTGYGGGPVKVYVKSPVLNPATKRAVRSTNAQAGFNVFKTTSKRKSADVIVRKATGSKAMNTGISGAYKATGKGQVKIGAQKVGNSQRIVARTVQHELGHTVGLAHPGTKKNPYMAAYPEAPKKVRKQAGAVSRAKSRASGIMGSGKELSDAEIAAYRSLRKRIPKIPELPRTKVAKKKKGKR